MSISMVWKADSSRGGLQCTTRKIGEYASMDIEGDILGINDCLELAKELHCLIDEGYPLVMLDLTNANVISASFCGFLVSVLRKAKASQTRFLLVAPENSPAHEIVKKVKIDTLIGIFVSKEHVLANLVCAGSHSLAA